MDQLVTFYLKDFTAFFSSGSSNIFLEPSGTPANAYKVLKNASMNPNGKMEHWNLSECMEPLQVL